MVPTLNIIGCGNVGKVLGRLWVAGGTFGVQDVLNRTQKSSLRAAEFIGAGKALSDWADLRPADVFLIGPPDDQIEDAAVRLAGMGIIGAGTVIFHCSGALPSTVLEPLKAQGASVASVHPIRSFAGPEDVAASFTGTYCGIEGDEAATALLGRAFSSIGARLVPVDPAFKTIYHAAAVFSSNYLVALLDVAVEAYAKAGVPRDDALRLMEPLVRGAVDNVFKLGPTEALTGPIARGDVATVLRQYKALNGWNRQISALYKRLGKFAAALARRKRRQS